MYWSLGGRTTTRQQYVPHSQQTPQQHIPTELGNLEPLVRFYDINFNNTPYEDVVRNIDFNQSLPGERTCAYYGSLGYSYGRVMHRPAEYPVDNEVFRQIFETITQVDSYFTPQNLIVFAHVQ